MGFDKNFQKIFVLFSPVHDYHHTKRQQTNPLCFQFCLENKSRPKINFFFSFFAMLWFLFIAKAWFTLFLYNNKWQCNSFFCIKKKYIEILWFKKIFLRTCTTLNPLPHCTQSYALGLSSPLPLCAYVLCG